MADKPLRVDRWGDGTSAAPATRTRVIFDTTGMADRPLNVSLRRDRVRVGVSIGVDGAVRIDG